MYFSSLLLVAPYLLDIAFASPGLFDRAACNADNCLRAVRATAVFDAHLKDCSTNAVITVTPCPVTVIASATTVSTLPTLTTTTSTVTTATETDTVVVPTVSTVYFKRAPALTVCSAAATFTPSVPIYASACSGAVRYSSACSCLGVTVSTTTLDPVTVLVTNTLSLSETPLATETITLTSSETTATTTTSVQTSSISSPAPVCSAAGNLIKNPSFEEGTPGSLTAEIPSWTRLLGTYTETAANAAAHCGNDVLAMVFTTALAQRVSQDIPDLVVGRQYNVAAWVRRANKAGGNCQNAFLFISKVDYSSAVTGTVALNGDWQKVEGVWNAPTTSARLQLATVCPAGEEVYFDDVTFTLINTPV